MNRSLFSKTIIILCFINLIVFATPSKAQDVYIRISENDCVNLHGSFFSALTKSPHEKDFKFLFPNKFKGKRFEQFNKLYFQNKVTDNQVVFSDTLYNLTGKPLNGLSGIAWIHNNQLLSTLCAECISNQNINILDHVANLSKASTLVNFQEEGMSDRLAIASSYKSNTFAISDYLFRNIYYWDATKNLTNIDLKDEVFSQLLKNKLTTAEYATHIKYLDNLMKVGKAYPEPISIDLNENQMALYYGVPYAKVVNPEDKDNVQIGIMSLPYVAVIPLSTNQPTAYQILENSYLEEYTEEIPEYYSTMTLVLTSKDLYRINQLKYSAEDLETKRSFPLLSKLKMTKKNHAKTIISENQDGIKNFPFQQDTLLNKTFVMDIQFSSSNDHILLLNRPYAVNIKTQKKYTLDWDSKVNTYYYPATYTYEQLQFWETPTGFNVLVKKDENYSLKLYNDEWQFQSEKALPFYGKEVKNLRFTKNHVYVFTEDNIFTVSNTFES